MKVNNIVTGTQWEAWRMLSRPPYLGLGHHQASHSKGDEDKPPTASSAHALQTDGRPHWPAPLATARAPTVPACVRGLALARVHRFCLAARFEGSLPRVSRVLLPPADRMSKLPADLKWSELAAPLLEQTEKTSCKAAEVKDTKEAAMAAVKDLATWATEQKVFWPEPYIVTLFPTVMKLCPPWLMTLCSVSFMRPWLPQMESWSKLGTGTVQGFSAGRAHGSCAAPRPHQPPARARFTLDSLDRTAHTPPDAQAFSR